MDGERDEMNLFVSPEKNTCHFQKNKVTTPRRCCEEGELLGIASIHFMNLLFHYNP